MTQQTDTDPVAVESCGRLIERFMPRAEMAKRHETLVRAPADQVFDVAQGFDLLSIPLVRAIFRLRTALLGGKEPVYTWRRGILAETKAMGWTVLAYRPGREVVMGTVTQPWKADVVFRAVAPQLFADLAGADLIKIAWTLEAEPLGPALTRFRTETRVLPLDAGARRKFRLYWWAFGVGILFIRWLALPAIRRAAERRASGGETRGYESRLPNHR